MNLRSKDAIETSKQDNIIMNNILIAEFMGLRINHYGDYNIDKKIMGFDMIVCSPSDTKFHSSWDWLMPVVQKIGDEYLNTPFDETYSHLTEQYENIWTLEDTYNAVVEFVKEQNEIG
jgi:hypothetical protein|tara:strand:+ start:296 stop:649 length:354 start_codon:yes stop_codon:yes gene_type:complete